jgi:hypothetical protein
MINKVTIILLISLSFPPGVLSLVPSLYLCWDTIRTIVAVCTLINFGHYFGYNSLPRLSLSSLLALVVLLFWDLDVKEGITQFRNVYALSYDQEYYPKSQSSCFFLVVKSQGHHPILENITLDRTDALFLLVRLQTIELFCCRNLAANLLLQVRSAKLNILQEQCFGLGPLKRKGRSDRWQISRLKRHRPGHKSELWAILSCGMSVVGFVPNPSPSTQKVHVNLEVF